MPSGDQPLSGLRVLSVGNIYPPHDMGGGYELTWRSAVLHLRAGGAQVRVLTSDYRKPDIDVSAELDADVARQLGLYWVDHAFPKRSWRERIALERHNAVTLAEHLEAFTPDVVNWWGMGGLSMGLVERVRRMAMPAVGVVGDEWLGWGPQADGWIRPFLKRPVLARTAEWVTGLPASIRLGQAAHWIFNSEAVRTRILGTGMELAASSIAHPGIDDSLFRASAPRPWTWRLLYLGRLDPRKGVDTLLDAMRTMPDHATLVLQGNGDATYVEALQDKVAALGLEDRVTFGTAERRDLPGVYADSDVVVFPVLWEEPWGLVPLEAMAVGRPVVATGTGGSAEYLRHEENCLIFEPRDSAEALAAAVMRLGQDEDLRAAIRRAAFQTAARFTEDGYNTQIAKALVAAAASTRRP